MTLDEDDIVTEVVGDPPVMADLQRAAVRRAREARALEDALIELRAMRGRLIVKGEPDRERTEYARMFGRCFRTPVQKDGGDRE